MAATATTHRRWVVTVCNHCQWLVFGVRDVRRDLDCTLGTAMMVVGQGHQERRCLGHVIHDDIM